MHIVIYSYIGRLVCVMTCVDTNITARIYMAHPTHKKKKVLKWDFISKSKNINIIDLIMTYPDEAWDWNGVSDNPNTTIDDVIAHPDWSWKNIERFFIFKPRTRMQAIMKTVNFAAENRMSVYHEEFIKREISKKLCLYSLISIHDEESDDKDSKDGILERKDSYCLVYQDIYLISCIAAYI